jgi:phosphate transport system substrate-binding protein
MKIYLLIPIIFLFFACTCQEQKHLTTIQIDGSSTLFPLTEAVSEEFSKIHSDIRVTVGTSGTGGGFKKFIHGEIPIVDASRSIKPEEIHELKKINRDYVEIPVAYDGITIVVNSKNTWVDFLTIEELKKLWEPNSKVKTWKDIRNTWPAKEIKLYGPGTDSGTFDYFTEVINGKARASRSDYTKSEDDNVLVQGVMGDVYSLGYFGFSYYVAHKDKIHAVAIKMKDAVMPSHETILQQKYIPLSRALFIYIDKKSAGDPEIKKFISFYLVNAPQLAREVGFVPLPAARYEELLKGLK